MTLMGLFLFFVLIGTDYVIPNPVITPGATVRDVSLTTVCSTAWGKDVRHVTPGMKATVCRQYHAAQCPGPAWEIDHLIPRELGGADVLANLWPQPIAQARVKDHLENVAHQRECAHQVDLGVTQKQIASDWRALYRQLIGPLP